MGISNLIKVDTLNIDFDYVEFWNNLIYDNCNICEQSETITLAEGITRTYVGNFYGLLNNELDVPHRYWYPNLLLNGFKNSFDYNGETIIKIFQPTILEDYLNMYENEKKLIEKNTLV